MVISRNNSLSFDFNHPTDVPISKSSGIEEPDTLDAGTPEGEIVDLTNLPSAMDSTLDQLALALDSTKQQIEAELRLRLHTSRKEQGLILIGYQSLYKPLGIFGKFLKAIGIPSKSAYRLIEDALAVADLPEEIYYLAAGHGVDLAARKNRAKAAMLKDDIAAGVMDKSAAVANLVQWPGTAAPDSVTREKKLSCEEKRHWTRRMKIRTALNDTATEDKLLKLQRALEEEMYEVWGLEEGVSIPLVLIPRRSEFTLDGKKREVTAA